MFEKTPLFLNQKIKRQKVSFEFKANLKFNIKYEIYQSAIGSSELFHQNQQFVDRPVDRAAAQLNARSAFARARRLHRQPSAPCAPAHWVGRD